MLAGRGVDGFYSLLDFITFAEIGVIGLLPRNGQQEVANFDRLEIVEADLVAARYAKCAIGVVFGASKDLAEALLSFFVGKEKQVELIEAFL